MRTFIIITFLSVSTLFGQIKTKSADVFEELENGNLTLRIINAVNGTPIPDAEVIIDSVGTFTTDDEGKLLFTPPAEDGVLPVVVTAPGFIRLETTIEIMARSLFFNHLSLSPVMDRKNVRIVLDWGRKPLDLDAHFIRTGPDGYHLSFRNMNVLADGKGRLDIDARHGHGPETITVTEVSASSTYEYYIHDYTDRNEPGSTALSASGATVTVYADGKLVNTFRVPKKKEGTVWKVFRIDRGAVREVRQVGGL